ncbi:MAG: SPOR domain-containing protein [Pseudomonadota bacterium]
MAFPTASGPMYDNDTENSSILAALLGWLGAILSLTMVAGLAWWAYDIATRDSRAVPVIQAMEGPARIAPEEPGGFRAAHTGLAVNEIAGEGERAPVSDEIALAPAPTPVTESDVPMVRPGGAPKDAAIRNSVDRALMDALGVTGSAEEPTVVPEPGTLRRPQPRPAQLAEVSRRAPADPLPLALVASQTGVPLEASEIAPGTRLVQLGAFQSALIAEQEWTRLSEKFSEYFGEKRPVYEKTEAAGTTLWRLRAYGFDDRADARRFCEVLLAGQAECIPVLTR